MKLSTPEEQEKFDRLTAGLHAMGTRLSLDQITGKGFTHKDYWFFRNFAGNEVTLELFERDDEQLIVITVTVETESEGTLHYESILTQGEGIV